MRLLKEAVTKKFPIQAVKPLEKQSYMRDIDQYHGPIGCRFYLIKMMSKPPYDVFIGILCCLYILLLIALIIQDDYLDLEPTINGFKYS